MTKAEQALTQILKMIEAGMAENCTSNEIKAPDGTTITGDIAGHIIEFVYDIEDLARHGLGLPAKVAEAA